MRDRLSRERTGAYRQKSVLTPGTQNGKPVSTDTGLSMGAARLAAETHMGSLLDEPYGGSLKNDTDGLETFLMPMPPSCDFAG